MGTSRRRYLSLLATTASATAVGSTASASNGNGNNRDDHPCNNSGRNACGGDSNDSDDSDDSEDADGSAYGSGTYNAGDYS